LHQFQPLVREEGPAFGQHEGFDENIQRVEQILVPEPGQRRI